MLSETLTLRISWQVYRTVTSMTTKRTGGIIYKQHAICSRDGQTMRYRTQAEQSGNERNVERREQQRNHTCRDQQQQWRSEWLVVESPLPMVKSAYSGLPSFSSSPNRWNPGFTLQPSPTPTSNSYFCSTKSWPTHENPQSWHSRYTPQRQQNKLVVQESTLLVMAQRPFVNNSSEL